MTNHTPGTPNTRDTLSKPIPLTLASQYDLGDSPHRRAENFRKRIAAILISGALIGGVVADRLMKPPTTQSTPEQSIPTSSKQKPVNQSATNVAANNQTPSVK